MDLQALIARMDQIEALPLNEEDASAVIAKYTDHPELPAFIDSKDGQVKYMDTQPTQMGQPAQAKVMPTDWIKRYAPDLDAALKAKGGAGGAYGSEQTGKFLGMKFNKGTKVNTQQAGADASSAAFVKDMVAKITPLLAQAEKELGGGAAAPTGGATPPASPTGSAPGAVAPNMGQVNKGGYDASSTQAESYSLKSAIAKNLVESFGYVLESAMDDLAPLMAQVADIQDPALKPLQDKYAELLAKKDAPAPGKTDNVTGNASSDKFSAEKLARLKTLIAKLKTLKAPAQSATPAPAAGAADPLKANPTNDAIKAAAGVKESLSESERMALVRNRLAAIESQVDEGLADLAKGAWNVGKNLIGGVKGNATMGLAKTAAEKEAEVAARLAGGMKPAQAKTISDVKKITGLEKGANTVGKAIRNNPGKATLAATAAGAAAGYGLSGNPAAPATTTTPATTTPVTNKPTGPGQSGTPTTPTTPPGGDESAALRKEIEDIIASLADYNDPAVQKELEAARAELAAIK